jgi:DNA-binding winged helix-turn-helix (wHTH) protein/phage baseplate assembly protein W
VVPRLELNFPNPVEKPTDLFDRTSQLELIRETVTSSSRRIAVIMGERVTGKTSLLNVVHAWASAEYDLAVLRLAPVTSQGKLIEEILEGMAVEAGTSLYQLGYRDAAREFTRSTVAGFAAVAAELSAKVNRTFLVCLDELDSMLVNCRDDQSATEILDFIMYVSNTSLPIRFVFTLTRATPQIMRADATPFITAARIADLTPWTAEETQLFVDGLLSSRFTVDDSAHRLLYTEGGGHPYLTKAILQRLVDTAGAANERISAEQIRAAVAAALATHEVHLTLSNIVTAHFSADETLVLQRLARASKPLAAGDFASTMLAFSELRRRHYVEPAGDGFVLAFGLLGRWLVGQAASGGNQDGRLSDGPDTAKLVLDERRRRTFLGGDEIQLSTQEYRFVQCLAREVGTIVDRKDLADSVWPEESGFEGGRDGRLSQLVHRLRVLLGDIDQEAKYIETHRGFGFSAVPQNVERIGGVES